MLRDRHLCQKITLFKRLQRSETFLFKLLCQRYFVVGCTVPAHALEEAMKDLDEDLQLGDDSDSFSDSYEYDELELIFLLIN